MKKSVIFLLVLIPFFAFSQKEAAFWYFGNLAGLDFNSGNPVSTTGSLMSFEGSATMSDCDGNLLFYTDGVTVWDNTHNEMTNGTGLLGNPSSTQSAIIIPDPGNISRYYVVTVDNKEDFDPYSQNGIRYSVVDFSINPLGEVLNPKNNPLVSTAYEKITAVQHANNTDFWLITFIEDRFIVWLVSATGINVNGTYNANITANDSRGYLKISPAGDKIAVANYLDSQLLLYDFNNNTGEVISNSLVNLPINNFPYGIEFSPDGSKLFATTQIGNFAPFSSELLQYDLNQSPITQITISTDSNTARGALQLAIDGKIYRTHPETINDGINPGIGDIFLGSIDTPNLLASDPGFSYTPNAVNISNGNPNQTAYEGLPPFIASYFENKISASPNVCLNDSIQFYFNSRCLPDSINWDFGDPSSPDNTSTLLEPTHVYSSDGVFTVNADVTTAGITETLTVDVTIYPLPVVNSPVSLTECDDDLDGFMNFDLTQANSLLNTEVPAPTITYFLTEQDALDNINEITNATAFSNQNTTVTNQVWARVENAANCVETAQVELIVDSLTIPSNITGPFIACDDFADGDTTNGSAIFDFSSATSDFLNAMLPETNLTVNYYENQADALAESNTINASNFRNTIPNSQDIVVRINNTATGCFGLSSLTLTVQEVPEFDIIPATTVCLFGEATTVSVVNPSGNFTFEWQNSSGIEIGTGDNIALDTPGDYTIIATDTTGANCTTTDIVTIVSEPVQPLLGFTREASIIVTDNTFNNNSITVLLNNLPTSTYQVALDENPFQTELVFENVEAGLHTVTIRDIENCLEARVEVSLIYVPNFFTPNGDGTNDYWQVTGISFQPNSKIYIFDRFGKLIKILNPLSSGWDGYYKGNPLPSTDYWYKVELEDGRILKGHFSLIRR